MASALAIPVSRTTANLTMKICLAGDSAVGKTSLVRRFVSDTFDEQYGMTLGAKVSSRRYRVGDPRGAGSTVDVGATIWDIMGHIGFRELMKDAYFRGAQGVLLVCDATRPETFEDLADWWTSVRSVAGSIPAVVLLNKSDLEGERKIAPSHVGAYAASNGWSWFETSAKTGDNVQAAFDQIAQVHLRGLRRT